MKNAALAGALLLAAAGPAFAGSHAGRLAPIQTAASTHPAVSDAEIARFRAALRLRPDQESHWVAVAKVLRSMVRRDRGDASYAAVGSWKQRPVAFTTSMLDLRRLAAVARPLVEVLDVNQKMTALGMVQAMGFGSLLQYF
jgi:hypothetical protein